jgi:outer membrane receptor protein involved in Fe transport
LAYTAAQGNVNKVRVHGVELDSVFNLIPDLSLRLNGAYNIAKYVDYKNAAKPEELAYLPGAYVDMSGKILPGASKWSFVVGADYTKPVFEKYVFHTSVTTNFQSGYNNTDNLSAYGTTNSRSLTDFAIGVGTKNNMLDASFIVKNLFNNNEHEQGWNNYSPYPYPVWYGFQLSGKI